MHKFAPRVFVGQQVSGHGQGRRRHAAWDRMNVRNAH